MPTAAKDTTEFMARFWQKVVRADAGNDVCWLWQGALTTAGYGSVRRDGTVYYAHRVIYEHVHGPIPAGGCVLHRCDTPACVNPQHLFCGSKRDNAIDCAQKRRGNGRDGSTAKRLTDADVTAIRSNYATGLVSQTELALRFNVSQMTISKIVRRETWKHLPPQRTLAHRKSAERLRALAEAPYSPPQWGGPIGCSIETDRYGRREHLIYARDREAPPADGRREFADGVHEYMLQLVERRRRQRT